MQSWMYTFKSTTIRKEVLFQFLKRFFREENIPFLLFYCNDLRDFPKIYTR